MAPLVVVPPPPSPPFLWVWLCQIIGHYLAQPGLLCQQILSDFKGPLKIKIVLEEVLKLIL